MDQVKDNIVKNCYADNNVTIGKWYLLINARTET
jgi:hypothetical protein